MRRRARLGITVTRARSITVSLGGRRVRRITPNPLAERYSLLVPVGGLPPGRRHVVSVRVEFQHGSGSDPVTLRRPVLLCARREVAPRFTG